MQTAITPPEWNTSAVSLEIFDEQWIPNKTLKVKWWLRNSDGEACSSVKFSELTAEQYQSWGSGNDDYVIRCIAENVGLEIPSETESV